MRGEQRPFDAVICDVDGVVRIWPPDAMTCWDLAHGLPEGTLAGHAFAEHRLLPAITGQVTDEEWRAQVAVDLQELCGSLERSQELVAGWRGRNGSANADVVALLIKAREHVRVAALSNATTLLEKQLAELDVLGAFDAIVNTAREGVCKPDPRIYQIAAAKVGADPERCLFVDDSDGTSQPPATQECKLCIFVNTATWKRRSRLYSLQICNHPKAPRHQKRLGGSS